MIHIVPTTNNAVPSSLVTFANFVYLHGELENICSMDLCSFVVGNEIETNSIMDAKVHIDNDTILDALLFYWGTNHKMGLVVLTTDLEGLADATKKFNSEVGHL